MMGVFMAILGEQVGVSLVIYPLTWLIARREDGKKVKLESFQLHILGIIATGSGTAIIRYLFIHIIGVQTVLNPENSGWGYIFVFILPFLFSFMIAKYFIKYSALDQSKND